MMKSKFPTSGVSQLLSHEWGIWNVPWVTNEEFYPSLFLSRPGFTFPYGKENFAISFNRSPMDINRLAITLVIQKIMLGHAVFFMNFWRMWALQTFLSDYLNLTCLRKISLNCSSQIYFPNMWNWTIPHVWEKSREIVAVKYTSQPCGIEQFHMVGKTCGIEQFHMFGKISHIWANFFCFAGMIFLIFVHITGMLIQWL